MQTRYRVLMAIWLFQLVNYLDRVAISFAGPTMMKALGMTPQQFGVVLSSFAVGYLAAQVPGGILADRRGARVVMIGAPLLWALFTGLLGLASSVASIVVIRGLFGFSEGISNAACYKLVGDAFSPRERARATAIWATSFALGPALAGPAMGLLLASFDWHAVFLVLALPALAIGILNARLIPRGAGAPGHAPATSPIGQPSFRGVLATRSLWIIAAAYLAFNMAFFGYLGWMPTYLAQQAGVDLKASAMLGGIPYVSGLLALPLVGWLGSGPLQHRRVAMIAVLYALAAAGFLIVFLSTSVAMALVGLSATAFFLYGALSTIGPIILDHAPPGASARYSGLVTAIGQIGNIAAPALIGIIVGGGGSFAGAFEMLMAALVAASGLMMLLALEDRRTGTDRV